MPGPSGGITFSFSMGRVTLYLSMVFMMMEGVVRKKKSRKRKMLMMINRAHHSKRGVARCFLGRVGERRHAQ